jgi:hypothetical protein
MSMNVAEIALKKMDELSERCFVMLCERVTDVKLTTSRVR